MAATRATAAASSRSSLPPPPISAGSGEGGGQRPLPHGGGATTKETASADNVRRSSVSASATAASRRNGAGTRRSIPGQNDRSFGGSASAADRNTTSAGAAATFDPSTTASSRKRGRQNGTATAIATTASSSKRRRTRAADHQQQDRRVSLRLIQSGAASSDEKPTVRKLTDDEWGDLSDIFAPAFPDGSKFCVYVKEETNVIEIFAIYPPQDGIPEEPYANRTSNILVDAFGSIKFNWNDLAPFVPKGFCKRVKLKEIRRVLLSNPHIIADCFARMIETLDDNKVVYVAGDIPQIAFSAALGWGVVKELEAPGEYGVGRYQIGGKNVYAIYAYHPSSGITAHGKGSTTRALNHDLEIIRAVAEVSEHGYEVRTGELDAEISRKVSASVLLWKEGAKEVQKYLDIPMGPNGWWPEELRVLRLINYADPYFLETIKYLHEEKSVSKEKIRQLLSVPGVATAIARDGFKTSFKWLHEEKSVSTEKILPLLSVKGVASAIQRDGFRESFDGLLCRLGNVDSVLSALSCDGNARRVMDDFEFCIYVFGLLASGHVFGDEEIALSLFGTSGMLKYFGHDLNHCLAIICELSELLDNRLDLVAGMLTKFGVLGALFSNTAKSLEGVELLVEKYGPDRAVTSLGSSSRILRSYIENSEFRVKQRAEEREAEERAKLAAKQPGEIYSAVFHSRKLGLDLAHIDFKGSPWTVVSKVDGTFCMCNGTPIKSDLLIRRNDVLLSVAGKGVVGGPMNEVAALLSSSPRPVTLEFRANIR